MSGSVASVASIDELLAPATEREPMKTADSLSSAAFEHVVIGGTPYVVKYLSTDDDWIARAVDDHGCFALRMWRGGVFDRLPSCLDPVIVAVAHDDSAGRTALLMRDVSDRLVPIGSDPLPTEQHLRFCDHMAQLHASTWDWQDSVGLARMPVRYTALGESTAARERALGNVDGVPGMLDECWAGLRRESPEAGAIATRLAADPRPLVAALATTPQTLVHGDWKAGNLGSFPDGRTILLDWQWPGRAAPLVDLAWYLAVNCDRLPISKVDTVAAYRDSLERRGVSTDGWWDTQLELALLGGFVQSGWSKSGDELGWWADRAVRAVRLLDE